MPTLRPILITAPFTTAAEREALQRRIIDAVSKDAIIGPRSFWDFFAFYPYKNKTAKALAPEQLYDTLTTELDLFVPEDVFCDSERLPSSLYDLPPPRFSQPIVPTYYNEADRCEVSDMVWADDRLVFIVDQDDGKDVRFVKMINVDKFIAHNRACRRVSSAGGTIPAEQMWNFDSSDNEDEEQDDEMEEFHHAARFLARPTATWCRLRGLQATPIRTNEIATVVCNLDIGNCDFADYVISESDYEAAPTTDSGAS